MLSYPCLLITAWELVKEHGVTRNELKIHGICYITCVWCQMPCRSLQIIILPLDFNTKTFQYSMGSQNLWCRGSIFPKAILFLPEFFSKFQVQCSCSDLSVWHRIYLTYLLQSGKMRILPKYVVARVITLNRIVNSSSGPMSSVKSLFT